MSPTARVPTHKTLHMLEFFSGIGGMRLAVQDALSSTTTATTTATTTTNVQCHAYDISLHANATYRHYFHEAPTTKLIEQLRPTDVDGRADLWTMSPPCQPFTTTRGAKQLDMDDARCHGLLAIVKLLDEIVHKPRFLLLENVKGFATSRMAEVWKDGLRRNGYSWREYLLSPVQLGIPNHRQRYYMLCTLMNDDDVDDEQTAHGGSEDEDLEICTEFPSTGEPAIVRQPLSNYIDLDITQQGYQLDNFIVSKETLQKEWAANLGIVAPADQDSHCFTAGYGRIYHRSTGSLLLVDAEHALADVPLEKSDMTQYHGRLRRFTPVEILRLFGFPSMFSFPHDISTEQQYKLIGNSINVAVVSELVKELLLAGSVDGNRIVSGDPIPICSSKDDVAVGGTQGHETENIKGNILTLYNEYGWKMIPNCTGRYTCRDHHLASNLPPLELLAREGISCLLVEAEKQKDALTQRNALVQYELTLPGRQDRVLVVPLDPMYQTGLITFEKGIHRAGTDTSYVHTLNTPSGFRRKLTAMKVSVTDSRIWYEGD